MRSVAEAQIFAWCDGEIVIKSSASILYATGLK